MDRQALESIFRIKGWEMESGCLDDFLRGSTIYVIDAYEGSDVEVYVRLVSLSKPPDEGWGLLQWRGHQFMRTSSGMYGVTTKNGRWAWTPDPHQAITWALTND